MEEMGIFHCTELAPLNHCVAPGSTVVYFCSHGVHVYPWVLDSDSENI